ncbi:hypothetical protein [Paracoccus sp. (in: a-proteobacteria)]|uniref:hypothetical protein n=1 Tax=Paracoccus sp. TaxID=267 RepID=UPI002AFEBE9B|nr:hypothetical protein [Paracoccus sp. (in: a-proteobacteria)]
MPEQSGLTEAFRSAQVEAKKASEARVQAESELGDFRTRLEEKKRVLDEQERPRARADGTRGRKGAVGW